MKPVLLNLGCGAIFHPDWINLDLIPSSPLVKRAQLEKGIPYPDNSVDAVYHSHVLEHLTTEDAEHFIQECVRVLKPGGVLRVVVPDLEQIARLYLQKLDEAQEGKSESDYDWMTTELLDQLVRSQGGGNMLRYFLAEQIPNEEFVLSRVGYELLKQKQRRQSTRHQSPFLQKMAGRGWGEILSRARSMGLPLLLKKARSKLIGAIVYVLGGRQEALAYRTGSFRNSGEVHQWMYDRFSLQRMLQRSGLGQITVKTSNESQIKDFNSYQLDLLNGKTRKPDSLFMEGIKP